MDRYLDIYRQNGAAYHALIAAEDVHGEIPRALNALAPVSAAHVLDLGSGTGRIPLLLHGQAFQLLTLDLYRSMLAEQHKQMSSTGGHWSLVQADLRRIPLPGAWADLVTAGWAIGHFVGWYSGGWQVEAEKALEEMARLAAPGGRLAILETLGTGAQEPVPPNRGLAAYYRWLEDERGFSRQVLQTDYRFESVQQAVDLCGFFFGDEMAARVREHAWVRVPEWTGLWSRRVS